MSIEDVTGGPAYPGVPTPCENCNGDGIHTVGDEDVPCPVCKGEGMVGLNTGVTVLDVFAMAAMQGCKQNPAMYHWSPGKVTEVAYDQAESMLAGKRRIESGS